MTKSWRPEGWVLYQPIAQFDKDYKKEEIATARILTPAEVALFETGADAMLGALRANQWCPYDFSVFKTNYRGKVIIIPDDED